MAQIRVHEIARECGVTSKDILAQLVEFGGFVKSASSKVDDDMVARLRAHYESNPPPPPEPRFPPRPAPPMTAQQREIADVFGPEVAKRAQPAPPWPGGARRGRREPTLEELWRKQWSNELFEPAEVREWMKVGGFHLSQATQAARMRAAGFTPEQAGLRSDQRSIREWFLVGEPVPRIRARLARLQPLDPG